MNARATRPLRGRPRGHPRRIGRIDRDRGGARDGGAVTTDQIHWAVLDALSSAGAIYVCIRVHPWFIRSCGARKSRRPRIDTDEHGYGKELIRGDYCGDSSRTPGPSAVS